MLLQDVQTWMTPALLDDSEEFAVAMKG